MNDVLPAKRHNRFVRIAREIAEQAYGEQRLGAVLVKGGKIIGKGGNNYINWRHAETTALGKAWASESRGADLYVVRLRKEQPFGLSLPCANCMKMIIANGISRIFYTTNDPVHYLAVERC